MSLLCLNPPMAFQLHLKPVGMWQSPLIHGEYEDPQWMPEATHSAKPYDFPIQSYQ